MPASRKDDGYSSIVGSIFLFNLIVGTGALALPGALQKSGWIIGVVLLLVLGLVSFITVTFIVESLAVANAVSRKRYGERSSPEGDTQRLIQQSDTQSVEFDVFAITEKYELGQMGVLMSPKWCQIVIYASLCIYLFGDLAIYAVVFGKTWANILCISNQANSTSAKVDEDAPCFENSTLTALSVYRLSITAFLLLLGPFTFFNLQKTKILQIFTGVMRWVAFFVMITWCVVKLVNDGRKGNPKLADLLGLPTLFGTLVYSFMCQHSVPGLLYPIRNKGHLKFIIPIDFSAVAVFYLLLTLTAIFTFSSINEVYTLTFWDETINSNASVFVKILIYYLALYPVFTTGTNFPLLAITLRNNFRAMILRDTPKKWYYDQLLFPLIILLPPASLAIAVSDLHMLVGFIGSYCGTCVQYLIPCLLVTFARYHAQSFEGQNKFASPFKSKGWVYAVYVWMVISLIFITINYVRKFTNKDS